MTKKQFLLDKIEQGTVIVGIVGLGYVGLPLAVAFGKAGLHVMGVDIDQRKVDGINAGKSHIEDVPDVDVHSLVDKGLLRASTDYNVLASSDAISICVPTPLNKTGDPDVSYIIDAAENIARVGSKGKLIVLESTTYPGTTEEVIVPRVTSNGAMVGEDLFVAFSPERVDPGRTDYTMFTTPKVIGGVTSSCLKVALALYGTVVEQTVPVSSTQTAEMVKLLENTFRAVNIGLVNEIAIMCDKLGINVWEVVDAAATKPYGFMKFSPGPGLGGHCIPIDPHYLSWKLRTLNYKARFVELAAEVNTAMPEYVVSKVVDGLNSMGKAVNGSQILVLGVAYKPNVSDVRESPAIDIIQLLEAKGGHVSYHDPYVSDLAHERMPHQSVSLTPDMITTVDCVVIVTDHTAVDYSFVDKHSKLIIDTRNVLSEMHFSTKITL